MRREYNKFPVTAESLAGCQFFDEQDADSRARIARYCEGRRYRAKADIIRHGDIKPEVFFILSGQARANTDTGDGNEVSFQVCLTFICLTHQAAIRAYS